MRIAIPNFRDLHRSREFLVVVPGIVDTIADRVEPHLQGIEGLQQLRESHDVLHSGIEP